MTLLGGLQPQHFLDKYWQQKPLLIRQAFSGLQAPFTAEELAGMCIEKETTSKIVIEDGETP